MTIIEARARRELREFTRLPERLYRDDPLWAPPLWNEERKSFTAKGNPVLAGSDYVLLLAREGKEAVGRVLVFVDRAYNAHRKENTGLWGCFEARDAAVAKALFDAAEAWLWARGVDRILGPFHQYRDMWGFLLEGFDTPPMFLTPYNPPGYNDYALAAGYVKAMDLLAYEGNAAEGYVIPKRFVDFVDKFLARRPELKIRRVDLRHLDRDADALARVSNLALSDNWGFVPYNQEEIRQMLDSLRIIIDPDAVWFVEDKGEVVGIIMGFPDVNALSKSVRGRLFPFGIFKFLREARRIKDYRLFGLTVHPRYHGLGLDAFLYLYLYRTLKPKGIRLEANWVLETNAHSRNAMEKLELRRTKTYRIYEKRSFI